MKFGKKSAATSQKDLIVNLRTNNDIQKQK